MNVTGQFGVVRTTGLTAALIRLGTRSQVNHAFVVLDRDGTILEAEGSGARLSHLSKYPNAILSRLELSPEQRIAVHCSDLELEGTPYGWLDIAAITLLAFGIRWKWLINRAQSSNTLICSQLVDRAYANAGVHLYDDGRPDGLVTPGDLLMLLAQRSERTAL